jgi:hypothetical protein
MNAIPQSVSLRTIQNGTTMAIWRNWEDGMHRIENVLSVDKEEVYKSQYQNTGRICLPLEQLNMDCSWMNMN